MTYWRGETCECCGGEIDEKRVTLHRKLKGNYVLIENIPAGVCKQCGTRHYAANVLKTVEESIRGRRNPNERCASLYIPCSEPVALESGPSRRA
jgi:YgiT-type zinc finger domain-containing protein